MSASSPTRPETPDAGRVRAPTVGLFQGAGYPLRGARFVYVEHRALARYWLPPIALASLVTALAAWLVLDHRHDLLEAVWTAPPVGDGLWSDVLRWLRSALGFILTALALAFAVI